MDRVITDTDAEPAALHLERDPADVAVDRLIRMSWPTLDRHRRLRTATVLSLLMPPLPRG